MALNITQWQSAGQTSRRAARLRYIADKTKFIYLILGQFIQLDIFQNMHALLDQQIMVDRLQVFRNRRRTVCIKTIHAGHIIADDDGAAFFHKITRRAHVRPRIAAAVVRQLLPRRTKAASPGSKVTPSQAAQPSQSSAVAM